jgi:hypothetical protein
VRWWHGLDSSDVFDCGDAHYHDDFIVERERLLEGCSCGAAPRGSADELHRGQCGPRS